MGGCCCKERGDNYEPPATPALSAMVVGPSYSHIPKVEDPEVIDDLILEMLNVAASCIDVNEDSPVSLVRLHVIAEEDNGWIQMIISMVNVIPLENPFGPAAIAILIDDCPLPSKESVIKVANVLGLSEERATVGDVNVRVDRNLCIVLGCIAEKLTGPNSVSILTDNTLDYLLACLRPQCDPTIVLFALIALEKFAYTYESRLTINHRLKSFVEHPLLTLEKYADSEDYMWRQIGFSAAWALDNLFMVEGRPLSYEVVDMTDINALLEYDEVSEYIQMSSDGLEVRCDSYTFETVRCTFEVNDGCWYYEALIVTPGVMQIGWSSMESDLDNDDGYGIGDDLFSLSYDGCRRQVWFNANSTLIPEEPAWRPGDVLGCLIDLNTQEVVFSINGRKLISCQDIFYTTRVGFFAAASFMAYQQCRFNFGNKPFKFPPNDREFSSFNDYGNLTEEEKMIIPRRIYLERLRCSSVKDNACLICCNNLARCILDPCGHRGFCGMCASKVSVCPMCRSEIFAVRLI